MADTEFSREVPLESAEQTRRNHLSFFFGVGVWLMVWSVLGVALGIWKLGVISLCVVLPTTILLYVYYWRGRSRTLCNSGAMLTTFGLGALAMIPVFLGEAIFVFLFFFVMQALGFDNALVDFADVLQGGRIVHNQGNPLTPEEILVVLVIAFCYSLFTISPVEEIPKYLLVCRLENRPELFDPYGAVAYGCAGALGFATVENARFVIVLALLHQSVDTALWIAVMRALFTVPMHAVCGMLIGVGVARRTFNGEILRSWQILSLPLLIHGIYDFFAIFVIVFLPSVVPVILALLLTASFAFLHREIKRIKTIEIEERRVLL